jgi:hypothetical protein
MRGLYSGGFYGGRLLRWTANETGTGLYKMADIAKRGIELLYPDNIVLIVNLNIFFSRVLNKL